LIPGFRVPLNPGCMLVNEQASSRLRARLLCAHTCDNRNQDRHVMMGIPPPPGNAQGSAALSEMTFAMSMQPFPVEWRK
jgi:hypothetical protein